MLRYLELAKVVVILGDVMFLHGAIHDFNQGYGSTAEPHVIKLPSLFLPLCPLFEFHFVQFHSTLLPNAPSKKGLPCGLH